MEYLILTSQSIEILFFPFNFFLQSDNLVTLNFDKMITNLTAKFGKRIQTDLKKILTNRKSSIDFSKTGKQKFKFDDLSKFESKNNN